LERRHRRGEAPGELLQTVVFSGALLSGVATELIGVHVIFGAFLWGLAMPRNEALHRWLALRLETVVLRLLLPMFFAMSGLSTRIGSLNTPQLLLAALLVLLVAVAGKFAGTWAVARASGVPPREAQALGWLMNTRGLTELVDDIVIERAPVGLVTAASMVERLRIRRHARDEAGPLPADAAARFIARLSELAASAPWKAFMLEVNPIKWTRNGAIAVDGLLIIDEA
jgi:hypothetical protein